MTRLLNAQPGPLEKISSTGRLLSWVPQTAPTREVYSSSLFTFPQTILSNRPRSRSLQGSIIQTSILTGQFAWTSSDLSGPRLSPLVRFCCQSARCSVIPTLMIHWCQRLLESSKQIGKSTTSSRRNGPRNTPCDGSTLSGYTITYSLKIFKQIFYKNYQILFFTILLVDQYSISKVQIPIFL